MDKGSIIRTVILLVALINQFLVVTGHTPIPIDDELITNIISSVFTAVVSLWAWWKNNYISKKGLEQKRILGK